MSQASEALTPPSAQANIQDVFLNSARRERVAVTIHLMGGRQLTARIKSFDRFAVVVEVEGTELLMFKHAIATIEAPRSVTNYRAALHS